MKFKNHYYRIYGRTRGRNNSNNINKNYNDLLKTYSISKFKNNEKYILDIGSGYGETSIYLASKYRDYKIISCEKYVNGNYNLLKNAKTKEIKNINLFPGNVHEILDSNETNKFFNKIFIFFPDPWPKKKHNKRRLIDNNFFKKIYNFLKLNGMIYIVTDSDPYKRAILNTIYESKKLFKWINQSNLYLDMKYYFNIETKFYKKAIIYGRKPTLFILKKL